MMLNVVVNLIQLRLGASCGASLDGRTPAVYFIRKVAQVMQRCTLTSSAFPLI